MVVAPSSSQFSALYPVFQKQGKTKKVKPTILSLIQLDGFLSRQMMHKHVALVAEESFGVTSIPASNNPLKDPALFAQLIPSESSVDSDSLLIRNPKSGQALYATKDQAKELLNPSLTPQQRSQKMAEWLLDPSKTAAEILIKATKNRSITVHTQPKSSPEKTYHWEV